MEFSSRKTSSTQTHRDNSSNLMSMNEFIYTIKNILNSIGNCNSRTLSRVLEILLLQKNCSEEDIQEITGGNFLDFLNSDIGKKHFRLSTEMNGDEVISTLKTDSFNNFRSTRFSSPVKFPSNIVKMESDKCESSSESVFVNQQMKFKYLKSKGKLMISMTFLLCPLSIVSLQSYNHNFFLFTNLTLDAKFRQKYFGPGNLARIIKQNFENYLELIVIDSESFICLKTKRCEFENYCKKLADIYHENCGKEKIGLSRISYLYPLQSTSSLEFEKWVPEGITFARLFD